MNKKQHLIALDLDGTLLTDDKKITEHTKKIIDQAVKDGHIVVIATGRPHRASIQYYRTLGLQTPMVNFNGALTHHPLDQKWGVFHHPISHQTALEMINACAQFNVENILAEVQDTAYLDRHNQFIIEVFQAGEDPAAPSAFTVGHVGTNLKEDPTSLLIQPKDDHIVPLRNFLDGYVDLIEHRHWGAPYHIVEITKKGIHKAFGLKKIADYFQIPRERIIAFGDEDNDLEMIDYAGIGVAMENGINELKSIANYTTNTNEQNGVSSFLEDFLKIRVGAH